MINKQPKIEFVFDRRKVSSPDTKGSLEMRITYNYKQKYIATGILLYPNQWKKGKITNCPDILQLSSTLDKMLTEVRQILLDMTNEGEIDLTVIQDRLKQKSTKRISFIDYCKQRYDIRKYGKADKSIARYNLFLKCFEEWGVIKRFKDVNEMNLIAFDNYLLEKKLCLYTKWHNYHRHLNSVIIDAINEGLLTKNPYKNIYIDKGRDNKSINKYLTPDEFRRIKGSTMPTTSLERVRDTFVFQTYTCLRYSDLKAFDARAIQEIKGTKVYSGIAEKTNKPFTSPILSPAWDILMKYDGKLPIISNANYNAYLKLVAQAVGIDKPVSSHWARHTGATLLLNECVDLKIVSKICGHSSTRITEQIYAKLLDETVVDAIQEIKENLE
jgi:integrase